MTTLVAFVSSGKSTTAQIVSVKASAPAVFFERNLISVKAMRERTSSILTRLSDRVVGRFGLSGLTSVPPNDSTVSLKSE